MAHDHGEITAEAGDRRVGAAIAVNLLLTVAQVVGGAVSGSLALVADAVHNLSDALSLVIALLARRIARRPADPAMTFGYGRAEPVAALVNYTTLVVIAVWLGYEAVWRLADPAPIRGWIVVWVAGLALIVDLVTAVLIARMARGSMNMRAAFLHNLADAMGSAAVIAGGFLVLLYDWRLVDPLITLGISAYILWHAVAGAGPVIRLLMLGTPPDIAPREVLLAMRAVPGVAAVAHLHIWQIEEGEAALSAEIALGGGPDTAERTLSRLRALLSARFGIDHASLDPGPLTGRGGAIGCAASAGGNQRAEA